MAKVKEATFEERERVDFIISRASTMLAAKLKYSKNWTDYEKIYKMFRQERDGENRWRARKPDTWAFATIKTAQSAFVDSEIAPIFKRHEDDDLLKARDLKDLYDDMAEKGDLKQELYFARLDAFKFGTGFLKTTYIEDRRTIQEIRRFNPETGKITYKEKEVKDFDDPKTERVSPLLMLVDEMCRADFRTARDCIEFEILSYDDAKRKYSHLLGEGDKGRDAWDERVKTAGQIKSIIDSIATQEATTADENTRDVRVREFRLFAPVHLNDDNVEILHYWNRIEDTYEIVANNEPLRVDLEKDPSPIPYISKELPYSVIQYSPYSGDELWSAGIIEIGMSDILNMETNREMMSDRQKLSLFSPAFSDVNDEIDQRVLALKPMSLIRTRGGVPQQWKIPGITDADLALHERDEESFKRAVGIDERVLGTSPEGAALTATEIGFLREAALRRLREFTFLYKRALLREVRLKIKLFEQYFSSPFVREEHIKGDDGVKMIKAKAKQFNVSLGGNVYRKRHVTEQMFEGDLDVDLDMKVLIPMTNAQLVAQWGQILRDMLPLTQGGLVDVSIEKVTGKYLEAFEVNIETLRSDAKGESIIMAEGEHQILVSLNSTDRLKEILPEGTPERFLTAEHLRRHEELLRRETDIGANELANITEHMKKDTANFKKKLEKAQEQQQQAQQQQLPQGQGQPQGVTLAPQQGSPAQGLPSNQDTGQVLK